MKMFIYQIGIFIIRVLLLLVCDQNMVVGHHEGASEGECKQKYLHG